MNLIAVGAADLPAVVVGNVRVLGHRQKDALYAQSGVDFTLHISNRDVSCDMPTTENGCACIGIIISLAAASALVSSSPTEGEQSIKQ